jgi:hypothetical protein
MDPTGASNMTFVVALRLGSLAMAQDNANKGWP